MKKCKCSLTDEILLDTCLLSRRWFYCELGIIVTSFHHQYGCFKCRQVWDLWDTENKKLLWNINRGIIIC